MYFNQNTLKPHIKSRNAFINEQKDFCSFMNDRKTCLKKSYLLRLYKSNWGNII